MKPLWLCFLLIGCAAPVFDDTTWGNLVAAEAGANDTASHGCPPGRVYHEVTRHLERAAISAHAATPGSPIDKGIALLVESVKPAETAKGTFCKEQLKLVSDGIATLLRGYETTRGLK